RDCTRAVWLTAPLLSSSVADLADDHFHLAARSADGDLLPAALAEERTTQRRFHAHPRPAGVGLVGTDDLVGAPCPVLLLERDQGPEPHPLGVGLLLGDDDGGGVQATLEKANPSVDLPEAALAVDVFGVLAPVALGGSCADLGCDLRPFHVEKGEELGMHPLRPGAGEVAAGSAGGALVAVLV